MSGYVYFIACSETGRIKIGYSSRNPALRLKNLQTGSPTVIVIVGVQRGTAATERNLHRQFAAYRMHGEWFAPCEPIHAHIIAVNEKAIRDADENLTTAPRWARMQHALRNGVSAEEVGLM